MDVFRGKGQEPSLSSFRARAPRRMDKVEMNGGWPFKQKLMLSHHFDMTTFNLCNNNMYPTSFF